MLFLVEKDFIDKETKKEHLKGTIYETYKETRIKKLREEGYIGVELTVKEESVVKEEPVKESEESSKEEKAKKKVTK